MNIDDLLAQCPRCKTELTLDEMGCATCRSCEKEHKETHGYSAESTLKFVEEVAMPIVEMDYEIIILQKGGWDKIRSFASLKCSNQKETP